MVNNYIAAARLTNQRLIGERLDNPVDVVRWLGAVQAQDYPAAKWGVGQRTSAATNETIETAFNAGAILRTHVMRPTWHFVAPEDLRWLLALTGSRVHRANGSMYRRVELDDVVLRRTRTILTKALAGGRHFTRGELADLLEAKRIPARGQRLAYIIMHAELEGLICSGAVRGKQHTYALLEERVPPARAVTPEAGLVRLARRYFTSHGPATWHDFAWWSGLTVSDAKRATSELGNLLSSIQMNGKTYWLSHDMELADAKPPIVHLLPNYDEHVVAYRDHGPSLDPRTPNAIDGWGNALTAHLVVVNGLVVGGWRRTQESNQVVLRLSLPLALRPRELNALKRAASAYGEFLNSSVVIS